MWNAANSDTKMKDLGVNAGTIQIEANDTIYSIDIDDNTTLGGLLLNSIIVIILIMKYKRKEEIIKQFYAKCLPILLYFEQERKKKLTRMIYIESALVIICTLCLCNFAKEETFFESINSSGWLAASYVLMLVCAFAMCIYPYSVSSCFKEDLKSKIMPKVIKSFGTIHHATGREIFSATELMESTLFSRFNKMEADDSFYGTFDGVNCKILETELALQGHKYYSTSFKGVIVEFDSNKKINAKTTVTTLKDTDTGNKIPFAMLAYIILPSVALLIPFYQALDSVLVDPSILLIFVPEAVIILISLFVLSIVNKKTFVDVYNSNNKQIQLEDIKFAKKFKVFSEDEVEARYLVTTAFMERFLKLTTSFGTKNAKCAFFNNKVMFAISTRKNLFEFGSLFKPLDDLQNIGFFNELMSILDMIDCFKLDKKIGL